MLAIEFELEVNVIDLITLFDSTIVGCIFYYQHHCGQTSSQ